VLNGCRVDVRHSELALNAVDVEASKKLVSIYFYRNHNYMSHILEHIPWFQTKECLTEVKRILRPGGTIEIWVPDLAKLIEGFLNPSLIEKDGWYKHNPNKDPTIWLNGRLFTYGPGEENWHRAAFTREYLTQCLAEAGFVDIFPLEKPRGYYHGWINLGVGAKVLGE
jgi:hypothetical protein